jgi:hypothetical protein
MAAEQCFDEAASYRLASALRGIPAADPGQYDAITVVHALQGLAHGECRNLVEQIAAAAQPIRIAKRAHCSAPGTKAPQAAVAGLAITTPELLIEPAQQPAQPELLHTDDSRRDWQAAILSAGIRLFNAAVRPRPGGRAHVRLPPCSPAVSRRLRSVYLTLRGPTLIGFGPMPWAAQRSKVGSLFFK